MLAAHFIIAFNPSRKRDTDKTNWQGAPHVNIFADFETSHSQYNFNMSAMSSLVISSSHEVKGCENASF